MKARKFTKIPLLMVVLLTFVSCVTVNIYFPAAEIKKQAEEIVDEVYKDKKDPGGAKDKTSSSLQRFISWLGPRVAYAEDYTSISNASIRGLKKTSPNTMASCPNSIKTVRLA
jgi:lipopolysaccharide export LptBFGC system permease protein LptF